VGGLYKVGLLVYERTCEHLHERISLKSNPILLVHVEAGHHASAGDFLCYQVSFEVQTLVTSLIPRPDRASAILRKRRVAVAVAVNCPQLVHVVLRQSAAHRLYTFITASIRSDIGQLLGEFQLNYRPNYFCHMVVNYNYNYF